MLFLDDESEGVVAVDVLLYENSSGNKLAVGAGASSLEPFAHREPLLQVFARALLGGMI